MIESGTDLIYRLSGNDAKVLRNLGQVDFFNRDNERGRISLKITPELITTRSQERPFIGGDIFDVVLGPF